MSRRHTKCTKKLSFVAFVHFVAFVLKKPSARVSQT